MTEQVNEARAACRQSLGDRIFVVLGGYSIAAFAAGIAMGVGGFALMLLSQGLPNAWDFFTLAKSAGVGLLVLGVSLVFGGLFFFPSIALLAALPAIAIIWFAERRSVRSATFYAAMGGLAAAVVISAFYAWPIWKSLHSTAISQAPVAPVTLATLAGLVWLFVVPGVCGGLVYWAIAGRDAGCDLQPRTSEPRGTGRRLLLRSLRGLRWGAI